MTESEIRLPDVGEGIAQAEVVQWHVAVGDQIVTDQPFVDVMTDKATVELPSPISGVVIRLAAAVGDLVAVGAPLLWLERSEETGNAGATGAADRSRSGASPGAVNGKDSPATDPLSEARTAPLRTSSRMARPHAAPAVRRRAADLEIDLADVVGSGDGGRIVHADLDAVLRTTGATSRPPGARGTPVSVGTAEDLVEVSALTGLRRNIARRMQEAHQIPHFSYIEEIEVGALEHLRAQLNNKVADRRSRLTVLPFLMRAVSQAISDFPGMNARYDAGSERLERHSAVHLGIATQAPNGLMVPVVRNAGQLDLWTSAAELRRLADAAIDGTIKLADLSGSTITITSLGALGGLMSTPIINAPEVAIIGVNRIVDQPVLADGELRNRRVMNLSSSFDHRVIDGWDAARFIHRIKELLESPALLFVDD